jgi:small subunit ribosomal protein S16
MVKIRLMRMGAKKRPFFRVVVADSRSPRDGRFIENIGKYHPLPHPSVIEIDEERALHWLQNGAQPSDPVKVLLQKTGIWERFSGEPPPPPKPEQPPEPPAEPEAAVGASDESPEAEPSEAEAEPSEATEWSPEEVVAQRAGGERASDGGDREGAPTDDESEEA